MTSPDRFIPVRACFMILFRKLRIECRGRKEHGLNPREIKEMPRE